METWHILRCALSTQDWNKCYTGICFRFKCIMPDEYYIVLEGENSCHRKMESLAASHDKVSHYEFAAWKVSSRMLLDFAFSIGFQVGNQRVGVPFERGRQFYWGWLSLFGGTIISNILGFLYNVFRLWPLDQVSGCQPKSGCPIWAEVSVYQNQHTIRGQLVNVGFWWLLLELMRGLLWSHWERFEKQGLLFNFIRFWFTVPSQQLCWFQAKQEDGKLPSDHR